MKIFLTNLLTAIIILVICYFAFSKSNSNNNFASTPSSDIATSTEVQDAPVDNGEIKTFVFDNFHGSLVSYKFQMTYPSYMNNDGQYFSPQKIEHYDLYSVTAPFYYDLILASIYDQTEFKNQIDSSKRNSP